MVRSQKETAILPLPFKQARIKAPHIILRYFVDRIGAMHQHMDPLPVSFLQNAGLENVFQTRLLAFIGAAVIKEAGIPGHVSGLGKHDAQVLEFEAGASEMGSFHCSEYFLKFSRPITMLSENSQKMKHVVGPRGHGVEILCDGPADRSFDAFFNGLIICRIIRRGSRAFSNKKKNEKNKEELK